MISDYKINSEFKTNPTSEYYIGIKLLDFFSFYPNQASIKRIRLTTKKKSVQLLQRMIDYSREVIRYQKSESSYSVVYELWPLFNNLRQQRHTIRLALHIDERICSKLIKRESSISTPDKHNGSYWRFWSCPVISRVRSLDLIRFVFFWTSTDSRANFHTYSCETWSEILSDPFLSGGLYMSFSILSWIYYRPIMMYIKSS